MLNGARFIRATIESVLRQTYVPIDYVVADGGSNDGTLEIAAEYGDRLRVIHGPDDGQSDAIRNGFAATQGEFVAYLNADDTLMPDAVSILAAELEAHPEAAMAYGDAVHVDENGTPISPYPTRAFDAKAFARECFISQPATLIRRSAYDAVGGIDGSLRFAMDYDLWLRLAERYPVCYVSTTIATSRMHLANKTLSSRMGVYREIFQVVRRARGYVPYEWWAGYASQILAPSADQFFRRPRPMRLVAPLALIIGLKANPSKPRTVLLDWLRHRSFWVWR